MDKQKMLKWIECNMVLPFEGYLQSENEEAIVLHQRLTQNIRTKFNKLVQMGNEGVIE
jgi:hypothetical protein